MIDDTEVSVLMRCRRCKFQEYVPLWVLEELNFTIVNDLNHIPSSLRCSCPNCDKTMYPVPKVAKEDIIDVDVVEISIK